MSVSGKSWKVSGLRTFLDDARGGKSQHHHCASDERRLKPLTRTTGEDLVASHESSDCNGVRHVISLDDRDSNDEKH